MTIKNQDFFIYLIRKRFVETTCLHDPESHISIMQGKYDPRQHFRTFQKGSIRLWFDLTNLQVSVRTRKTIRYLHYFPVMSFDWDDDNPPIYLDIPIKVMEIVDRQPPKNRYIPQYIKNKIWERDEGCCQECGSVDEIEFDHIFPVSRGGGNHADNIQLLCKPCNRKKGKKIFA